MNEVTVHYHTIHDGEFIYRGNGWSERDGELLPNMSAFFGINPDHVAQYGRVHTYQLLKTVKLLSADNIDDSFYNQLPADIQIIVTENFGKTSRIRDSESIRDKKFLKYLCENGYDGYAITSDMETLSGGVFHHEIALCNPTDAVEYIESQELSETELEREREKQTEIRLKKDMKSRRKTKKRNSSPPSSPPSSYTPSFMSFDSPPTTPPRKLKFGGGSGRKTKRKNKI